MFCPLNAKFIYNLAKKERSLESLQNLTEMLNSQWLLPMQNYGAAALKSLKSQEQNTGLVYVGAFGVKEVFK